MQSGCRSRFSLSRSLPTTLFWAWTLFACSISTNITHSYRIPMHSRKKNLSGVKRSFSEELSYIACIIYNIYVIYILNGFIHSVTLYKIVYHHQAKFLLFTQFVSDKFILFVRIIFPFFFFNSKFIFQNQPEK